MTGSSASAGCRPLQIETPATTSPPAPSRYGQKLRTRLAASPPQEPMATASSADTSTRDVQLPRRMEQQQREEAEAVARQSPSSIRNGIDRVLAEDEAQR